MQLLRAFLPVTILLASQLPLYAQGMFEHGAIRGLAPGMGAGLGASYANSKIGKRITVTATTAIVNQAHSIQTYISDGIQLEKKLEWSAAEQAFRSALAAISKTGGPGSPESLATLQHLSKACEAQHKLDDAIAFQKTVLSLTQREKKADETIFHEELRLSNLLVNKQDYSQAEPVLRNSIDLLHNDNKLSETQLRPTLSVYGQVLRKLQREDEANKLEKAIASEHDSARLYQALPPNYVDRQKAKTESPATQRLDDSALLNRTESESAPSTGRGSSEASTNYGKGQAEEPTADTGGMAQLDLNSLRVTHSAAKKPSTASSLAPVSTVTSPVPASETPGGASGAMAGSSAAGGAFAAAGSSSAGGFSPVVSSSAAVGSVGSSAAVGSSGAAGSSAAVGSSSAAGSSVLVDSSATARGSTSAASNTSGDGASPAAHTSNDGFKGAASSTNAAVAVPAQLSSAPISPALTSPALASPAQPVATASMPAPPSVPTTTESAQPASARVDSSAMQSAPTSGNTQKSAPTAPETSTQASQPLPVRAPEAAAPISPKPLTNGADSP